MPLESWLQHVFSIARNPSASPSTRLFAPCMLVNTRQRIFYSTFEETWKTRTGCQRRPRLTPSPPRELPKRGYLVPVPISLLCLAIVEPIGWERLMWPDEIDVSFYVDAKRIFLHFFDFPVFSPAYLSVGSTFSHLLPFLSSPFWAFVFVFRPNRENEKLWALTREAETIYSNSSIWVDFTGTTSTTVGMAHRPDSAPNRILLPEKKVLHDFRFGHDQVPHHSPHIALTMHCDTRNVQLLFSLLLVISNHQLFISLFFPSNLVWTRAHERSHKPYEASLWCLIRVKRTDQLMSLHRK